MNEVVLSIFPGIDVASMGFEEQGCCVVRWPDPLWGGDIHGFHPPAGVFWGIIGGPPCQVFSRLRYINPKAGQKHGNLIPEFERVVGEATPAFFMMENVPDAPLPDVPGYKVWSTLLKDWDVGGVTVRKRRFSFGTNDGRPLDIEYCALYATTQPEHAAMAGGGGRPVPVTMIQDGNGGLKEKRTALKNMGYSTSKAFTEAVRKQGLPEGFLDDAPFTMEGKHKVVGNAWSLPMSRAIAKAVVKAMRV